MHPMSLVVVYIKCTIQHDASTVGMKYFKVFYGPFLDVVRKRNSSGSVPGTSSPTEIAPGLSVSCYFSLVTCSFVTLQIFAICQLKVFVPFILIEKNYCFCNVCKVCGNVLVQCNCFLYRRPPVKRTHHRPLIFSHRLTAVQAQPTPQS